MLHWANWPMNLICARPETGGGGKAAAPLWNNSIFFFRCRVIGASDAPELPAGVHAVRLADHFDFDLTCARRSPGASAGCVFTQTARRHHLMALISISFKSILYSLPSFHLRSPLFPFCSFFLFFFLINHQPSAPPHLPSKHLASDRSTFVLMDISWGVIEAKVMQNDNGTNKHIKGVWLMTGRLLCVFTV